ncbi:MAG: putative Ig domain-containing protein [Verrucomicrobiae bacterium]|nr:putative Ig domain-containing protein [Verrucomicrobiae bacterium]
MKGKPPFHRANFAQSTFSAARSLFFAALLPIAALAAPDDEAPVPPDEEPTDPIDIQVRAKDLLPRREPFAPAAENPVAPAFDNVGGAWTPMGPSPISGGQVEGMVLKYVCGAINTVIAHPTNPDIVYIGAVNGGVWKTTNATATNPTWSTTTGDFRSLSIGCLAFDTNDATRNTVWAGIGRFSSYGRLGGPRIGLLKTDDGGASWQLVDGGGTLTGKNISGIVARGNTIVISSNQADSGGNAAQGVWRSTDGGATFTRMSVGNGSTTGLPEGVAYDIYGDPVNLTVLYTCIAFPSTSGTQGIYKSSDTGATWARVSDTTIDGYITTSTSNIELSVGTSNNVYVGILESGAPVGIFRSGNGGSTWQQMDLPTVPYTNVTPVSVSGATNASPIVITTTAVHGLSSNNYVEISGVIGNTAANGLFQITVQSTTSFSLDFSTGNGAYAGGGSVQKVVGPNPRGSKGPEEAAPKEIAGGQGSIHFSLAADPSDPNIVYLGGDRQDTPFPNYIGASNYSGNLWRGDASVAPDGQSPSSQWKHLTHSNSVAGIPGGGTSDNSSPHADSREMAIDANGNLIETDDGGVFRRTSPKTNTGAWTSMAGTLQITEAHSVAYDTLNNVLITGNQDNGTSQQNTTGALIYSAISTGDGGDVAAGINPNNPAQSVRYSSFQNLGSFRRRVYSSSNSFVSQNFPALSPLGGAASISAQFTTPIAINRISTNRLLIGGGNGVYESLDEGATVSLVGSGIVASSGLNGGRALIAGGRKNGIDNPDLIYVGAGTAVYSRTAPGGSLTPTPGYSGSTVRGIAVDPEDSDHVVAIDSNQVFRSTNGGTTWTDVTGDIPSTARDFRSVEIIRKDTATAVIAGTVNGIFAARSSAPSDWATVGSGMPNAPVWELIYDISDDLLIASTLGRGVWEFPSAGSIAREFDVDLSIDDVTVTEGNSGSSLATFTVTLAPAAAQEVRVDYTTVAGTASSPGDYATTSGTLIFSVGQTSKPIAVTVVGDTTPEDDETFEVRLSNPVQANLVDDTGVGEITNDDYLTPIITSSLSVTAAEGEAFEYQIVAQNTPRSYSLSGSPPAGMSIDTNTGLITWMPPSPQVVNVQIGATNPAGTDTETLTITVEEDGLKNATESPLNLTTGTPPWFRQTITTHDGVDAAESGNIGDGETTYMELTTTGPDTLHFWWRVSSESSFDFLRLSDNGSSVNAISGESGWQEVTYSVPSGTHTLRWSYEKDGSVSSGSDAGWVDEILLDSFDPRPNITSADTVAAAIGKNFSHQITTSQPATSFSSTALPPGLALNPSTGLITGIPSATGTTQTTITATNASGSANQVLTILIASPTTLPFTDGFESGSLGDAWAATGTNQNRIQVTTANVPHSGAQHVTLDDTTGDTIYSRNELTLFLDTSDTTDLALTFWAKEFGDEDDGPPPSPFTGGADFDGVAISDDGVDWYEVQPMRSETTSTYAEFTVDLEAAMAAHGLNHTDVFQIRFNQYDNFPISSDGIALDDISVTGTSLALSAPDLTGASDSGDSNMDNITSNRTPTFTGTSQFVSQQVSLYSDVDGLLATTNTNGSGDWTMTSSVQLAAGDHEITARRPGGLTSVPLNITVDFTAPATPSIPDLFTGSDSGSSSIDNITNDSTPSVGGTAENGVTVEIYGDAFLLASPLSNGSYSATLPQLAEGSWQISARARDVAGNTSSLSAALTITIDTVAPAAPTGLDLIAGSDTGDSPTDNVTRDNTPTFSGHGDAGTTVELLANGTVVGSANGATNWNITASALTSGDYSMASRQTDVAGNVGAFSNSFVVTIDLIPPAAPGNLDLTDASDLGYSNTDNFTADVTPTIAGNTENGATVTVFMDGIAKGTGPGGMPWAITVSTGVPANSTVTKQFTASAVDIAGNQGPVSAPISVTFDTFKPAKPIGLDLLASSDSGVSNTDNITNDDTPEFTAFSIPDTRRFHIYANDVEVAADFESSSTWTAAVSALADGVYQVKANHEDEAGNLSDFSNTLTVTIDATAPAAPHDIGLDPGDDTGLSNTDGVTQAMQPTLQGMAEPGELTIFQDGVSQGVLTVAGDGAWSFTPVAPLPEGDTVFTANQSDLAGNDGPLSTPFTVTVDVTPPDAPTVPVLAAASDLGPFSNDAITSDNTPTFEGDSEAGTLVTLFSGVEAVGSGFANSPWSFATDPLSDGTHQIHAQASDLAGNTSPTSATKSITIDTVAPEAEIDLAAGQDDPTVDEPLAFELAFSKPVYGLTPADLTLSGPASAGAQISLSGTDGDSVYGVGIENTTGEGDVQIDLPSMSVTDLAGNPNSAAVNIDNIILKKLLPGDVSGVTASDDAFSDRIEVTWTAHPDATVGYRIFRHAFNNPANAVEVGQVGPGVTTFDDTTATAGLWYYYWVRGEDEDGVGGFGDADPGRVPGNDTEKRAVTPLDELAAATVSPQNWETGDAAKFDGLLRDASDGFTLVGAIGNLIVRAPKAGATTGGSFSATMFFEGKRLTLRGVFGLDGMAQFELAQRDGSIVSVDLQLSRTTGSGLAPNLADTIRGTVTWNGTTAEADLPRAPYHSKLNPAPASLTGPHTVLMPALPDWGVDQPGGDGWALATVSPSGQVKVTGILGDGTRFSESGCLSGDAEPSFCLYTELYRSKPVRGRFGGRLVLRDMADTSDFDGVVQWKKFADTREKRYPNGFSVEVWALGSKFTAPAKNERVLTQLADQEYNAELSFVGPTAPLAGAGALDRVLSWLSNNRLVHYGPEKLAGAASARNGTLKGTFFDPVSKTRVGFSGVAFQKQGIAGGFFLNGDSSGAVRVKPGTDWTYPGSEDAGALTRAAVPGTPAVPPVVLGAAFDPAAAGVYHGVLRDPGAAFVGGLENVKVSGSGAVSGTLWFQGTRFGFRGAINGGAITINRKGLSPLVLTLDLGQTQTAAAAFQLTGDLSIEAISQASIDAQRRPVFSKTDRSPLEGPHTLAMRAPDGADPALEPAGDGYGTASISYLGTGKALLFLADGAKATFAGHFSADGEWSLHRGLYGSGGFLAGKITARPVADVSVIDGLLRWLRPAGTKPANTYPNGFDTTRAVVGSAYAKPATGERAFDALADDYHNAWLRIVGNGFPDIDRALTWDAKNRVLYYGPEKVKIGFNSKTGLVSGSYFDKASGTSLKFGGAYLDDQDLVTGFYLFNGESDLSSIEPR